MTSKTRNILMLLLLTAAGLTACVPPKTVATMKAEAPQEEVPEVEQRLPVEDMDTNFLYLAAQNAIKDGDGKLAIELLEALAEKDPEAIEPRLQLVELLLQYRQFDKAEAHVGSLFDIKSIQDEQLEQMYLLQARAQAGMGDSEAALASLDKFLQKHPENIHARDLQVRILASLKRVPEALAAIEKAIRINDMAGLRLLQAQLLLNEGDRESAKLSLRRMQELDPGNDMPVLMLNSIAAMEGKPEEAEKLLKDFLAIYPDAIRVSDALGRLLTQQNRIAEAILLYRERAARAGNDTSVLQTLGFLYLQHGDYEDSEKTFRKVMEIQPGDAARFYLAASLEALERAKEASEIYQQIESKSGLFPDAQLRLAGMDFRENRLNLVEKRLKGILKSHPKKMEAHLMLSSLRVSQKKYQLLLDESGPLLDQGNVPPQLLFNRAIAFEQLKDYAKTEEMLRSILANNPNYAEALNFLGYVYALQGTNLDQAEQMIRRALEQKPGDGYYLDSLAWVYYKNGDYAKAVSTQKKAMEKIKDDPVMHEHLGDMLFRTGDEAGARQAWQKAIELDADEPAKLKKKISSGLTASE